MKYAPFVEDSDDTLSQLAQMQVFMTLLSSLALRASPPSEVVGQMVTVILFLVPLVGVFMETPLVDYLRELMAWLKAHATHPRTWRDQIRVRPADAKPSDADVVTQFSSAGKGEPKELPPFLKAEPADDAARAGEHAHELKAEDM